MDQSTRNKLRNVVTQCRRLLEDAVSGQLEGRFGIYANPKKDEVVILEEAQMANLSDEERSYRKDLLAHYEHIRAFGSKPKDALGQLVREIAFTHLNRLCAYKMMEAREVYIGGQKFREAVSRGVNSNGVKFYLADHPEDERLFKTGHQDIAYRNFLDWLGSQLSEEIGVLFNPNDPANRLYPPQRVLDDVLALMNDQELAGIWSQDETIGWVYQYFTPKELRDQARKESQAPRNSYELAFRNQFFTPRYVVEFLTDNTLGRIWYEMRKGDTALKEQCRYMVRRPTENFLGEGESAPKEAGESREDLSQEELLKLPVYISHRPKKDPRDLKILDPACGSGHFLLYSFDLLLTIYEEAYNDPALGSVLRADYPTLEEFKKAIPALVLKHNLHGIDIDLRCTQIAALALWLRCQREYQKMGLRKDRPPITKSNIVCAEPMPGEQTMLKEFVAQLKPKLLGQLIEVVFDKMKLAGEAGLLLKIEEEIREVVAEAKRQSQGLTPTEQLALFSSNIPKQEKFRFDLSGLTDDQFFEQAESRVVDALRTYAEQAHDSQRFQKRLFFEDTVRGFSFIEMCYKKFDLVLMNPPFGESNQSTTNYFASHYPDWNKNLLCAFIARAWEISTPTGFVGVIFDRTAIVKSTYEDFRKSCLIQNNRLSTMADLGWGVLDANVEVTTSVLVRHHVDGNGVFFNSLQYAATEKERVISNSIAKLRKGDLDSTTYYSNISSFERLPNSVIGYDFPNFLRRSFHELPSLVDAGFIAYTGHQLKAEKHFRLWWEVSLSQPPVFVSRMFNGSSYSPYSAPLRDCVIATSSFERLSKDTSTVLRNKDKHYIPGVCFGKRGDIFCVHALPEGHIFTVEGQAFPLKDKDSSLELIGLLNTPLIRYSLNRFCGQHKYSGYVNLIPYRVFSDTQRVRKSVQEVLDAHIKARALDETQSIFLVPNYGPSLSSFANLILQRLGNAIQASSDCESLCHSLVLESYKVSIEERNVLEQFRCEEPSSEQAIEDADTEKGCRWFVSHSLLSHSLGYTFGRWDIRIAINASMSPHLPDPFDPMPICSPGMLQGPDCLPASETPAGYPLRIDWDGIIVDDTGHPDDIIRRIREVLELIWKDQAEAIEKEACEILSIKDLRDYFRKPGKGGFWDDHVSRYSKSRRKAPIYWLLQSSKKNYALWIYYHRLDKDILFKALLNYVEPKIRLEENCLDSLRSQRSGPGDPGKTNKKLDKEIEKQEDFLSELRDFEDKLKRAANLQLDPDLNDGVVLNIAPLHELVPWKEAKDYWEELLKGKYEWSSIGKQMRDKGLVK